MTHSKRIRVSKNEKWSSNTGAEERITAWFPRWQRVCTFPGTPRTNSEEEFEEAWSWLVQLQSGNFVCKCCSYVEKQQLTKSLRNNTLSSPTGLTPSKWTRLQSFRQHAQNPQHKKAAILFVRDTMKDIPLQSIPSASEDFVHLLKTIKERKMKKEEAYGGRYKLRRMLFCLAEASRQAKRHQFTTASQACMMHDGADSKLFARYALCTKDIERKYGFFGVFDLVQQHKTADSLALASSLSSIITNSCTQFFGAPYRSPEWKKKHEKLNEKAYNNIRVAISQLVADEAADEGRARELLVDNFDWDSVPDLHAEDVNNVLPNAYVHSIDKAHSAKRILQRNFNGIPQCKEVKDRMVQGRQSPAKLIHNSVQFQEQYSDAVVGEQIWNSRKLKDLGMSACKFSSIARPLVRMTLTFHATCCQMNTIWQHRDTSSEEAVAAVAFAEWLELDHALLLGFMADAAAEGVKLIRNWEPENSEVSSYIEHSLLFLQTVTVLFKERRVLDGCTFGAFMISELKRRDIVFAFKDGSTKMLSKVDVTEEKINAALDVMCHWVDLLKASIKSENPNWELIQAFNCLSITHVGAELQAADAKGIQHTDDLDTSDPDSLPWYSKCINTLANFVGTEPGTLRLEVEATRPLVKRYVSEGATQREAWGKAACQRLANAARREKEKPHEKDISNFKALAKVLQYYQAWSISTCGVEREIGDYRDIIGPKRKSCSINRINDELECLHIPNGEMQAIAQKACQIYLQIYSRYKNAKKNGMGRCDIGSSKRRKSDDTTSHTLQVRNVDSAQHVFRQRDCSIRQLVAESKTCVVNVMDLGTCNNESTEKFGSQKEFRFLSGKFMKKLRTIVRRHKNNDNEAEFSGEKLRKATRLLEANGYTMDGKNGHKDDTHLLKACQKRRAALNMQSRKVHIMKLLKGETDGALTRRAWVLKTEGNACSKKDAIFNNTWFWKFDQVPRPLSDTGVRVPAWLKMRFESPKILITHQPDKLPDWLQIHASMGGFFVMHWDCFINHGDIGCIVKHKAWAKMHKVVYISAATKAAYPHETTAIANCAACNFSNILILREEKKQASIAKAQTQPKHATRYVWIIRKSERKDYMGLKNVCGMKEFVWRTITSVDHDATLTGMGGQ